MPQRFNPMNKKWLLILMILLAGCTMAPKYERPDAPVPKQWPKGQAYQEEKPAPQAFELAWRDFIQDERLREVIAAAIANNRDLRVAGLNVEKPRPCSASAAQPFADRQRNRNLVSESGSGGPLPSGNAYTAEQYSVNLGLASGKSISSAASAV